MFVRVVLPESSDVRSFKFVVRGNPVMEVKELSQQSHQYDFDVEPRGELLVQTNTAKAVLELNDYGSSQQVLDFIGFQLVFNPDSPVSNTYQEQEPIVTTIAEIYEYADDVVNEDLDEEDELDDN